ncbi:MAG: hypothetical protein IPK63_11080 [Candidatus Competibacteraceae bacterium]|nr:hypothetical protein [Candidatus Competibacteraceae bacterium]
MNELKAQDISDILIAMVDSLKDFPRAITAALPRTPGIDLSHPSNSQPIATCRFCWSASQIVLPSQPKSAPPPLPSTAGPLPNRQSCTTKIFRFHHAMLGNAVLEAEKFSPPISALPPTRPSLNGF